VTSNSTSIPVTSRIRQRTLDGFVAEVCRPGAQGLRVPALQPLTRLTVITRNTTYQIVVRGGARVLVKGGRFFPQYVDAYLAGSGHGGSLLKLDWIAIGLRMELWSAGRAIVTSPVRAIAVEPEATASVS